MQGLKIFVYALIVFIVQTVVIPRLNLGGVFPDLILVSVIIFAVLKERNAATFFSAAMGFTQDVLAAGIYINMIVQVLVSNIVSALKEGLASDKYSFAMGMVILFSPLVLLIKYLALYFFFEKTFGLPGLIFKMTVGTVYNGLTVIALFPVIKEISGGIQEE